MAIVFYDTETTGINTSFDQVLQFAAIRTDENLNEIDRFEIRCRLRPHIIPAPGALKVTGVTVDQLTDPALPSHYEMICAIRSKMLSWSPALFVGYNSLDFDEHLMRQAYYQTLHPPYLTNTNGNSRSDVMRMVQAASIYNPNCLTVPLNDKGKPTFRLDQIAPANGFDHKNAHDALADVEATIHMCRVLSERAPEIWSTFMRFSQKAAVVDYIASEDIYCLSEFYYGKHFSWLVTTLGQNKNNSSEYYLFNLEIDPYELMSLTDEQLSDRLKFSPKPLRRIRCNAAPILMAADDAPDLTPGRELHPVRLQQRLEMLKADPKFCSRLIEIYETIREEKETSIHIEEQIYDGFFTDKDQKLMDDFHLAPWEKRLSIIENFSDNRLKHWGLHLIHVERPDLLEESMRLEHDRVQAKRIVGSNEKLPWRTLSQALKEIEEELPKANDAQSAILLKYRDYLIDRVEQANRLAA